jgi:N-acylneuraminate cytidylyltransferase
VIDTYCGHRVLGVIPARRGSRRLAEKNRQRIGDRTLVEWAVHVALACPAITHICLSTDDDWIAGQTYDPKVAIHRRPPHLATDETSTEDVVRNVLETFDSDIVVLLQPTSPLRHAEDITAAIDLLVEGPLSGAVVSVSPIAHPIEWTVELDGDELIPAFGWDALLARSQDCADRYLPNGAIYATWAEDLRSGQPFLRKGARAVVMPAERSIDIDHQLDLDLARVIHQRRCTP